MRMPEKNPSPALNTLIIFCLTVTFSILLIAVAADAIFAGNAGLIREILQFVQYAVMALLAIAGGRGARDFFGK